MLCNQSLNFSFFSNVMTVTGMKHTGMKVSLDCRRAKTGGTYPLILRLTHNQKTTSIKTGFHFRVED